jgi:hypothetical protein
MMKKIIRNILSMKEGFGGMESFSKSSSDI